MAESSGQDRTEQPTSRRLQQARDEGRIPRSVELTSAAAMLSGAVLLGAVGGRSLSDFAVAFFRESAHMLSTGTLTAAGAVAMLRGVTGHLVLALLPMTGGVAALVLAVNLAQAGGVLTTRPITPKLSNLSLLGGLKRMGSP